LLCPVYNTAPQNKEYISKRILSEISLLLPEPAKRDLHEPVQRKIRGLGANTNGLLKMLQGRRRG
jgi:hypothetical protein